jgi:hypothetical protein
MSYCRTMMRKILLTLLILNALLLPLGCVAILAVVNTINPLVAAFVTDIHVTNQSGQPITVTPIGTMGAEGHRYPLPVYISRFPAIAASRCGGFAVEPGATRVILYDWDDTNLSEIVVDFADGTSRQWVVDPEPTKNQYRPPATNRFVIDAAAELEVVPANVAAAAAQARQPSRQWLVVFLLLLPCLTFYYLLQAYRRRCLFDRSGGSYH